MDKILIFGNSGSGKTTLAKNLAIEKSLLHLDLDVLAWESPGVRKTFEGSVSKLNDFINSSDNWVIEGCYGSLIRVASNYCTELLFLNPGIEVCLRNNRNRPWEPHKYKTIEAQDKNFRMLENWVEEYEFRNDEYSLDYHRGIFEDFEGKKQEVDSL